VTATGWTGGERTGPAPVDGPARPAWRDHPVRRFDELLGRRVSLRAVALLRVLVGPIAVLHLRPFLEDAADGLTYQDVFHHSYASWYPDLPRSMYIGVLVLGVVAAVAMTLGVLTRVAAATTFGVVAYNLFLSTTHMHNNTAYLVMVLAILAMAPCGRELSVDAWWRRRRGHPLDPTGPAWPIWLLRFECSLVYAASGFSKLIDPDWFGGTVTWGRIVNVEARVRASVLPDAVVDLLVDRSVHTVAAKVIVATELFIALGLWWRRSRLPAVWIAVVFHVLIELSASVQVFSYLGIAVLLVWAEPTTRDRLVLLGRRDRTYPPAATAIRRLDWLARFKLVEVGDEGPLRVVDRDGSIRTGFAAGAFVASRLPVTAFFALPLTAITRDRRRARRASRRRDEPADRVVIDDAAG
jgi:uncharacterized membrane protein YphA (DoxX/SURF4 family)